MNVVKPVLKATNILISKIANFFLDDFLPEMACEIVEFGVNKGREFVREARAKSKAYPQIVRALEELENNVGADFLEKFKNELSAKGVLKPKKNDIKNDIKNLNELFLNSINSPLSEILNLNCVKEATEENKKHIKHAISEIESTFTEFYMNTLEKDQRMFLQVMAYRVGAVVGNKIDEAFDSYFSNHFLLDGIGVEIKKCPWCDSPDRNENSDGTATCKNCGHKYSLTSKRLSQEGQNLIKLLEKHQKEILSAIQDLSNDFKAMKSDLAVTNSNTEYIKYNMLRKSDVPEIVNMTIHQLGASGNTRTKHDKKEDKRSERKSKNKLVIIFIAVLLIGTLCFGFLSPTGEEGDYNNGNNVTSPDNSTGTTNPSDDQTDNGNNDDTTDENGGDGIETITATFTFTLNDTKDGYVLTGIPNDFSEENVTIPNAYNNLPVTKIGDSAFANNETISWLTISNGITEIGDWAFKNCNSLTNVVIPDSLSRIGEYVFYNCDSLTSIEIPNSVKELGRSAFHDCDALTKVIINDNSRLEVIGAYAFYYCENIEDITIPQTVSYIGEKAFEKCEKLNKVYIHDLGEWCRIDFKDVYSNPMHYANSLYLNGTEIYGNITLPNGTTAIPEGTFKNASALMSIQIPEGLTTIGASAFQNCEGITEIALPKSVTKIGADAFRGCTNIENVCIADLEKWCLIEFCDDMYSNPMSSSKTENL